MMIKGKYRLATLFFGLVLTGSMLLMVACGSAAGSDEGACPEASAGQLAFSNEEHGFCLLYPEAYTIEQPSPTNTELVIDSLMNHTDPRLSINVEEAGSRTMEDRVDEYIGGLDLEDFGIERSTIQLGGVEATLLDNMPGQDLNRQIVLLHDGMIYHLFFSPLAPDDSGRQAAFDELYDTVISSFTFQAPPEE